MKKSISTLACVLLLLSVATSNVLALNSPYGQVDRKPDSDDHTWGGENQLIGPKPQEIFRPGVGVPGTGFTAIDVIFNSVILEWLIDDIRYRSQVTQPKYHIRSISTQKTPATTTNNNRGN
jgi:hypothetical protein